MDWKEGEVCQRMIDALAFVCSRITDLLAAVEYCVEISVHNTYMNTKYSDSSASW